MKPGAKVFLKCDLGDHYKGRSVVVPRETVGYFVEAFNRPEDGRLYARVRVPTSPGQPELTTDMKDFDHFWRYTGARTAWDRVTEGILDE